MTKLLSSPRKRGPTWVPALAEFIIGPRFARARWLGRDDRTK
jgi:hypothetical protein